MRAFKLERLALQHASFDKQRPFSELPSCYIRCPREQSKRGAADDRASEVGHKA